MCLMANTSYIQRSMEYSSLWLNITNILTKHKFKNIRFKRQFPIH